MDCPACRSSVFPGQRFCPNCGARLAPAKAAPGAAPPGGDGDRPCPACRAPVGLSHRYCTSCGRFAGGPRSAVAPAVPRDPVPAPAPPAAAAASAIEEEAEAWAASEVVEEPARDVEAEAAPSVAPARPVGRTQSPGEVTLLAVLTLGIYVYVWVWRIGKEVDSFTGGAARAMAEIRIGLRLLLVGVAIYPLVFFVVFLGGPPIVFLVGIAAIAAAGVGAVRWWRGVYRIWSAIEASERARSHPKPLSPGLLLALVLIPYVNLFYGIWHSIARTQQGLNGIWDAERSSVRVAVT